MHLCLKTIIKNISHYESEGKTVFVSKIPLCLKTKREIFRNLRNGRISHTVRCTSGFYCTNVYLYFRNAIFHFSEPENTYSQVLQEVINYF